MRKKGIAWMLMVILLLGTLAGCSGGEDASTPDASQGGTSGTEASGGSADEDLPENLAVLNTESDYPVVNTPITLTLMGSRSGSQGEWEDLKFFKKWQELTGITLDMDAVLSDNWDTQKNLAFASNTLPDIFYAGSFTTAEELDYGDDQKMLLDISGLIDTYSQSDFGAGGESDGQKQYHHTFRGDLLPALYQ